MESEALHTCQSDSFESWQSGSFSEIMVLSFVIVVFRSSAHLFVYSRSSLYYLVYEKYGQCLERQTIFGLSHFLGMRKITLHVKYTILTNHGCQNLTRG